MYIGMVGKDGPRKLILRYHEHEREGRAFQRVYGKRLKQHQLYETMKHTGSAEWVMIPLQICTEKTIWKMEQQWMRTMGRVFNKEHRAWRGQRWRMVAQNLKQHADPHSTRELRTMAHKIVHTRRCHTPAHTLLDIILQARSKLQKGFERDTYHLLFHKVRSHTHFPSLSCVWFSLQTAKNSPKRSRWPSWVFIPRHTSSMCASIWAPLDMSSCTTGLRRRMDSMLVISSWKRAGALATPKGMTLHLNILPRGVMNARSSCVTTK